MSDARSMQRYVGSGEIIVPGDKTRVLGRRHPLSGRFDLEVPAGLSIEEIVDQAMKLIGESRRNDDDYLVQVDGTAVPGPYWRRVRVKTGVTVTIIPLLKGGNSAELRSAASALIAIAALVVALPTGPFAPFIGSVAAATGVSFATAASLAAVGVMTNSDGPIAPITLHDFHRLALIGSGSKYNAV